MADKETFYREMQELLRRAGVLEGILRTGRRTDDTDREYIALVRLQNRLLGEAVLAGIRADATPEWQGDLLKQRSCLDSCDAFYEEQRDLPDGDSIH